MGATDFSTVSKGATAKEAFRKAVDSARHEFGHGGYTGSIAEKSGFRMVTLPAGRLLSDFVKECFSDETHFCNDKWGDAACIALGNGEFLFFGIASE